MVGATTVLRDDPELTVRAVKGRNPLRVILDGRFRIGGAKKVLDTRKAPTLIITSISNFRRNRAKVVALEKKGVQVIGVNAPNQISGSAVLKVLAGLGITSVLIEGGSATVGPFIDRGLVNRVHCFIHPGLLGSGLQAFNVGRRSLRQMVGLADVSVQVLGEDLLLEGTIDHQ
jgi:diaminohydroxyphosphoribosylaminopyrimidine deaminase/5-amino-6-(5-phosphoribosylamino)uracil reductase